MNSVLTVLAILTVSVLSGCASLQKEQYFVCPYDTVWDAAVDTMKDRPVVRKDKDAGVIETAWTEMAANGRGFGVFNRDLFDSKERARMLVELKRVDTVTKVMVAENRERWHVRGGVTQQAVKWTPIEPSEPAMASVMGRLTSRVAQQGCTTP